jgi:hypothetical protein
MQTVFSHIVQKRFSKAYEDVATEALAFVKCRPHSATHSRVVFTSDVRLGVYHLASVAAG